MNQPFKLRYDQMRAGDPTKEEPVADPSVGNSFYETPGNGRNLCFVWPDGRQMFLTYAYLVAGEFTKDGDANIISLQFSTHTVTMKGYTLAPLFTALLKQLACQIVVVEPRYATPETSEATVMEATINRKGD